jgi:integrase
MPRKVRDTRLETRDARDRLKPKHEPYWRQIEPGLFLGYRKGARGGVWFSRRLKDGSYKHKRLGKANDHADANGIDVLDYAEAQRKAIGHADSAAHIEAKGADPDDTVSNAMDDYKAWFKVNRKGLYTVESHMVHIKKLSPVKVSDLTRLRIRRWHEAIAEKRTKSTANRVLTTLKAALNRAWEDEHVTNTDAWRRVKPFKGADKAKVDWLSVDECRRLQNACEPDFRDLVHGALVTGARLGELTAMLAGDYDVDNATVQITESKSDKSRHVFLTEEGVALFERLTAGKPRNATIFTRADCEPWRKHHQIRRMRDACARAKIEPAVSFHALRHSYASLLIKGGVPLPHVAKALGHGSIRMVEIHYGHLAPSDVADAVRAHLPNFGAKESNVKRLRR